MISPQMGYPEYAIFDLRRSYQTEMDGHLPVRRLADFAHKHLYYVYVE